MEHIYAAGGQLRDTVEHLFTEHVGCEGLEDVGGVDVEQRPGGGLWKIQQTAL